MTVPLMYNFRSLILINFLRFSDSLVLVYTTKLHSRHLKTIQWPKNISSIFGHTKFYTSLLCLFVLSKVNEANNCATTSRQEKKKLFVCAGGNIK